MTKKYLLRGLTFGLIAGIAIIAVAMVLRLGGATEISYYPWIFGYTILVGIITFTVGGFIARKDWSSLTKGLIIGIVSYIALVAPIMIPELYMCRQFTINNGGYAEMCGLFSATAVFVFLPIIPLATIVGWIKGIKRGEKLSGRHYWLKGGIVGLVIWLIIVFISEHFYFFGKYPDLWRTLFLGRGETGALWIYVLVGMIIGVIYGKIRNK